MPLRHLSCRRVLSMPLRQPQREPRPPRREAGRDSMSALVSARAVDDILRLLRQAQDLVRPNEVDAAVVDADGRVVVDTLRQTCPRAPVERDTADTPERGEWPPEVEVPPTRSLVPVDGGSVHVDVLPNIREGLVHESDFSGGDIDGEHR